MEGEKKYIIRSTKDSVEFNLSPIWNFIKERYRILLIIVGFFLLTGIFVAIFSPLEYSSSIELLEESTSGQNDQQRSLFQNLNIFNVGSTSSGLGEDIYPDIVSSTPFVLEVMQSRIYFSKYDSLISLNDYYQYIKRPSFIEVIKKNTIGLPNKIIIKIFGSNKYKNLPLNVPIEDYAASDSGENEIEIHDKPLNITREQLKYIRDLSSRITLSTSDQFTTITSKMPDPMAAAALTEIVYKELTKYIIEYNIKKATTELDFINERTNEARQQFYDAQDKLAKFTDRNQNMATASAHSQQQKLQAEFDLAFNLYKNLSQQLDNAKIKVKQNTPIFNVLEPVQIPIESSEPRPFKIIFIAVFFGFFSGFAYLGFIFIKNNYNYFIKIEN